MSIGSLTLLAIAASALATLVWWIASRLSAPAWVGMFVYGVALALVIMAGPLIRLP